MQAAAEELHTDCYLEVSSPALPFVCKGRLEKHIGLLAWHYEVATSAWLHATGCFLRQRLYKKCH